MSTVTLAAVAMVPAVAPSGLTAPARSHELDAACLHVAQRRRPGSEGFGFVEVVVVGHARSLHAGAIVVLDCHLSVAGAYRGGIPGPVAGAAVAAGVWQFFVYPLRSETVEVCVFAASSLAGHTTYRQSCSPLP